MKFRSVDFFSGKIYFHVGRWETLSREKSESEVCQFFDGKEYWRGEYVKGFKHRWQPTRVPPAKENHPTKEVIHVHLEFVSFRCVPDGCDTRPEH